jgi:hypothetical protein
MFISKILALRNFAIEKQKVINQNKLKSKNYNLR